MSEGPVITREMEHELRTIIAVAEAGWKGSPCWHVLDWLCWKQRIKYPLIRECDRLIKLDYTAT